MNAMHNEHSKGVSRRELLASIGALTVASATPSTLAAAQSHGRRFVIPQERFGRLFPKLRPFAEPSRGLKDALLELGRPGGLLDAKDDLAAGPVRSARGLGSATAQPRAGRDSTVLRVPRRHRQPGTRPGTP
jgi:hypothetical protein